MDGEMIAKTGAFTIVARPHAWAATSVLSKEGGCILLVSRKRRPGVLAACIFALVAVVFGSYQMMFGGRTPQDKPSIAEQRGKVAALGRIEPQSEIINLGAGSAADRLATPFGARHLSGHVEQTVQRDPFGALPCGFVALSPTTQGRACLLTSAFRGVILRKRLTRG
jgi:hypothetical protein